MCGRSSGSTTASFASAWESKISPTSSRASSAHSASDRLSSGMSTLPGSCPPRMVIPSSEHMTRILTIIQCRSVYISSVGRSAARQPRVVENQHLPHRHPPFGIVEEPHDSGRRGRGTYSHSVLFPILVHLAQKVHLTPAAGAPYCRCTPQMPARAPGVHGDRWKHDEFVISERAGAVP